MLNSLWGKFGERIDKKKSMYCTEPKQWFDLLAKHRREEIEIKTDISINGTLFVEYTEKQEEKCETLHKTNVALCSFVTGNARMRLWSELNKLGTQALYCDTDSIIYEHRPDEYNIPKGVGLGDWEVEDVHYDSDKKFRPMISFVSTGPKCKAFIMSDGEHECGAKGFTLDVDVQQKINYQGMKSLVTKSVDMIEVRKDRFKRTKEGMLNFKEKKELQFTMNKRCLNADYTSMPLGYSAICAN